MLENIPSKNVPSGPVEIFAAQKKKRLWRNIFLLNLGITIFLIGIFWLPLKAIEISNFFNSPSVNLPQKGKAIKQAERAQSHPDYVKNLMAPQYVLVNASSEKDWTYFDFSRGKAVDIYDPSSLEWDLAFRRGKVITNGGATNKFGDAGVKDLGVKDFETVAEVPVDSYVQDASTRTETENPLLKKWYKYNYLTHKLSAKKNIYAMRTAKGKYAKVQFLSFYCENKETGCIKMRYVYQDNGTNSFLKTSPAWAEAQAAADPKNF
ncbi:MAG: HmuY family protein [Nitrospinales bacterium]